MVQEGIALRVVDQEAAAQKVIKAVVEVEADIEGLQAFLIAIQRQVDQQIIQGQRVVTRNQHAAQEIFQLLVEVQKALQNRIVVQEDQADQEVQADMRHQVEAQVVIQGRVEAMKDYRDPVVVQTGFPILVEARGATHHPEEVQVVTQEQVTAQVGEVEDQATILTKECLSKKLYLLRIKKSLYQSFYSKIWKSQQY